MWACEVDPREADRCCECTTTRGSPGNRPCLKIDWELQPSISTGKPPPLIVHSCAPGNPLGPLVPDPGRVTRRLLCLAVALTAALVPSTPSSAATAADQWSWPLAGTPTIVRAFEPPPEPWLPGHRGVDLLASPGETVRAAGAGRVAFAGWVGGIPAVTVMHPDGRRTTYQPVLATVVRGHEVARGAILGRVSTGGSHCLPRACLHWGLRLGSRYLDPLSLVGAEIVVRLLPVWSARPAVSAARTDLARLGALNRARATGRLMT